MSSGLHSFAKRPPSGTGNINTVAGMAGPNITITTGTNGTDFSVNPNTPVANNLRIDLPISNALNTGKLSNTDWIIFNAKMTDPMTTIGDMIFRNALNVTSRLPVGANGTFLGVTAGIPTYQSLPTVTMETDTFVAPGAVSIFTLSATATNTKVRVHLNGLRQTPTTDYTATTTQVTFVSAPLIGDIVLVDYLS